MYLSILKTMAKSEYAELRLSFEVIDVMSPRPTLGGFIQQFIIILIVRDLDKITY